MSKIKPENVDEYINAAPHFAREKLREIRSILKKAAPNANEVLKWGNPVFMEKRILFAYSAHKTHINFVPTGPAMAPFLEELSEYNAGKDSFQIPYDKPLPGELILKIAEYRVKDVMENDAKWMY
jgi:uncharacterized protein YdhG (YjbR/CyaY superfamily)